MELLNFLTDDPVMAWFAFLALLLIVVPAASVLWRRMAGRSQADVAKQPAQVTKPTGDTRFTNHIQTDLFILFLGVVGLVLLLRVIGYLIGYQAELFVLFLSLVGLVLFLGLVLLRVIAWIRSTFFG